jgi:type I restriction enzyme M protein
MPGKKEVLAQLPREMLLHFLDHYGLSVSDRRVKVDVADALANAPQADFGDMLAALSRDELKAACRALGLDDSGKEKAVLAARLQMTAETPRVAAPAPTTPAPAAAPPASAPPPRRIVNLRGVAVSQTVAFARLTRFQSFSEIANFLWSVADLLRGDYKQADYGKIILPLTVLRRLDCVLADTKAKVLAKHEALKDQSPEIIEASLNKITGVPFHNTSKLDFASMLGDPGHLGSHLTSYIKGFSKEARDIFIEHFKFVEQISRLEGSNLLYLVMQKFGAVDLHPNTVPNHVMGLVFEELIRRFSEQSNETAGEHFTPREVIRLMVDLLFIEDDEALRQPGIVRSLFDPACGTGGMLSVAEEYLREMNPDARLAVFGQELNPESFAICKSDMMLKGQNPSNIAFGNSFSEDGHIGQRFDYLLSNPPFGVEWKKVQKVIEDEHDQQGFAGRFGPGLPRISDGSLLFLLHKIAKMKPVAKDGTGGSRLAIVFNGSPLFSGDAGSGESEIRRWVIENDWLEAIVGLPDQLFYNTGISTYVWVLTNRKPKHRRGKVQLIDATDLFVKMRKSLGNKRNELSRENIAEIVGLFGEFKSGERAKVFDNEDFGYRRITVERPLRLNFSFAPERIERLKQTKGFTTPPKKTAAAEWARLQEATVATLATQDATTVWKNRASFEKTLVALAPKASTPLIDAMLGALSERDETADICLDSTGKPECDADLRDNENVPLKEDIHVYFDREVKPHVPDAWIDEEKTKVGYEIPFTRHFYKYKPLRPLAEIEKDILNLEGQIQGMLAGVLG